MIKFQPESPNGFYHHLRQNADQYLAAQPKGIQAYIFLWSKCLIFIALFLFSYIQIWSGTTHLLVWYAFMGFLTVPLILNIGHEAVHDTFTGSRRANRIFSYIFNVLGADGDIWRKRHVHSHHVVPNIPGHDSDISQSKLARIAPRSEHLPAHRYQHFYMPFLYLIYTLNWLLYRDFKDVWSLFGQMPNYGRRVAVLLLSKFFYFGYVLALPLLLFPERTGEVWLGFFIMQFVMSATTFLVLVSAHVGEDALFPEPDAEGCMGHTWAEHQLLTTTDFAPENATITHLFGGFNHHAVHHLFPHVSHTHYPALTRIVSQVATQHGLQYRCYPSLLNSIASHFRFLKNNSAAFFDE